MLSLLLYLIFKKGKGISRLGFRKAIQNFNVANNLNVRWLNGTRDEP